MTQTEKISFEEALQRAVTCISQQRPAEALSLLQAILAQVPQHPDALHLSGIIAQMHGDYDRAIGLVEQARSVAPEHSLFARNLAEIYRQSGQTEKAIETGEVAICLDPGCAIAHSNLGIACYDAADYTRAAALQTRALELVPGFAQALNNLASIHRKQGDTDRAIALYREAMQSTPGHIESACNLGSVLVDEDRFDDALAVLQPLLVRYPAHAETHKNIGRAHLGNAQLDPAEVSLREAISLDPQNHEAHVGLSQVLVDKNWPELGLEQALIARQLAPHEAVAHHQVGLCYAQLGAADTAVECYEAALQIDPEFCNSIIARGYLALERGDFAAARRDFDQVARIKPDELSAPLGNIRLGKIADDDPDFAKLRANLGRSLSPASAAGLHYGLGKCYDDIGAHDEAFRHFAKGAAHKFSLIQYDAATADQTFNAIKSLMTSDVITGLSQSAVSSIAPIFILGMPRSGSTLIESILGMHSMTHAAGELNILAKLFPLTAGPERFHYPEDIVGADPEALKSRAVYYAEQTADLCEDGMRIIDKLPANFHYVGLIHALFPGAKIIHTKRHPLDTCLSCFTHLFERGQHHTYDMDALGRYYRGYDDLMQHWQKVLPENAFYTLSYEQLIEAPEATAREVVELCDLQWEQACLDFHTSRRPVRTASVSQVRQPIYRKSVARWKAYAPHLECLIKAIGQESFTG